MRKFIDYLHLRDVGWLEILFLLFPIIGGYSLGFMPMYLFWLFVIDLFAIVRIGKVDFSINMPVRKLLVFIILHGILWALILHPSSTFYNGEGSKVLLLLSFFIIVPALDYKKFVGSLNWIALIAALGLVYHFILCSRGQLVTPLKIPFLPFEEGHRFLEEGNRPKSFFTEPAAYANFMLIPLFIALYEKKLLWGIAIIITMFLSASTTGIAVSFIVFLSYTFTQKNSRIFKISLLIISVLLFLFLTRSSLFEVGMNKVNDTELDENERIMNGYLIVRNMDLLDFPLGILNESALDYTLSNSIARVNTYGDEAMFISGFWHMIINYGILGLWFLVSVYYFFAKQSRHLVPYVVCLFIELFTSSIVLNANYMVTIVFMSIFLKYSQTQTSNII